MQTLGSMLIDFKPPKHTREEWAVINERAEQFDLEEQAAKRAQRIEAAGIPRSFIDASITSCHEAVSTWAAHPGGKGLLLQGEAGRGKTYSACAALVALADTYTICFVSMSDVLQQIKATFSNQDTEQAVMERYANVGILCIDDVGKERLTEWSLPLFFQLIDKRHSSNKPTIITTNYSGRALLDKFTIDGDVETAKALASRFGQYERIVLEGADLRL